MEEQTNPANAEPRKRLASLDQFRGYTVAGMFLVNFLGAFEVVKQYAPVLRHNNNYISYADTIMPQFFFAVGFAMRLTLGRKLNGPDAWNIRMRFIRRCFTLFAISFVISQLGPPVRNWNDLLEKGFGNIALRILKVDLWETLALIAATSLWILPTIGKSAWFRFFFLVGCAALQMAMCHWFLFHFDMGKPNWLDAKLGLTGARVFDGGFFGFLTWCLPMLTGTLACDWATRKPGRTPVFSLLASGILFMAVGYGMSCMTTFYNPEYEPPVVEGPGDRVAASPVIPPRVEFDRENWRKHLAEPPFFPPRPDRPYNAWMMTKRTVSVSIMLFASGFSLAIYALFGVISDWMGIQIGLFRTLGSNALAAYVIHGMVERGIQPLIPKDSPWWFVAIGFAVFFWLSYAGVRYLERNNIFIRA